MVDTGRRIDEDTGTQLPPDDPTPSQSGQRRKRWPWAVGTVLVVSAAVAVWVVANQETTATEPQSAATLSTAEVVRTDLISETSYDGTLGRADGESIVAGSAGTVTASAAPGDTVGFGDEVFRVDGAPVVLLEGDRPAWRALGFVDGAEPIPNRAAGTLTSVAAVGEVIEPGDVLYEVDGQPVVAVQGEIPAYRALREGIDEGADVQQLEEALVALGYDPNGAMTVDGVFSSYTESLVELWQEDLGVEADGRLELGEVVFISGPSVVTAVDASIGDVVNTGQPVLSISSTQQQGDDVAQLESALVGAGYDPGPVDGVFTLETHAAVQMWQAAVGAEVDGAVDLGEVVFRATPVRISTEISGVGAAVQPATGVVAVTSENIVVTVDLPAEDQGTMAEGMAVTVELPNGAQAGAVVTSVASVATVAPDNTTVFEVELLLNDPGEAAGLDEAPVDVLVVTDSVEDVVAVPVASLLALAEGGYAVEIQDAPGQTRLVAVDPGFFADGLVEVTGSGVEPGQQVVVP